MGLPAHFSLEVVARCKSLIENVGPVIRKGFPSDDRYGGPLTTTFLLSMATTMIGLPIERIFKKKEGDLVADDTELNAGLSEEVRRVFDGTLAFGDAPFTQGTDWRLVRDVAPFNIAVWKASQHLEAVDNQAARETAMQTSAYFMMRHIRNALAHGGVANLDGNGRLIDTKAEMLALVSARKDGRKILSLNVFRVSEADFHQFLINWADWIAQSGVDKALSSDPLLVT